MSVERAAPAPVDLPQTDRWRELNELRKKAAQVAQFLYTLDYAEAQRRLEDSPRSPEKCSPITKLAYELEDGLSEILHLITAEKHETRRATEAGIPEEATA